MCLCERLDDVGSAGYGGVGGDIVSKELGYV